MVSQFRLKELFSYDETTGDLIRKINRQNVRVGDIAGSLTAKGYLRTYVDGRLYMNHILVWIMNFGETPSSQIDHINKVKTDNRLSNLRTVTNRTNCCNKTNHTSGFPGVDFHKKSKLWRARIRVGRERYSLGYFSEAKDAGKLYSRAAKYVENLITMFSRG
ncbi:HNH endonuclease [Enterobacteriaceae bacterium ML5]|nr:HNH endonuclease [Enterobacteriaceae bacterium ML5]